MEYAYLQNEFYLILQNMIALIDEMKLEMGGAIRDITIPLFSVEIWWQGGETA